MRRYRTEIIAYRKPTGLQINIAIKELLLEIEVGQVDGGLHYRRGAVYLLSLEQYVPDISTAHIAAAQTADEIDVR
jgi:hypothetical protein